MSLYVLWNEMVIMREGLLLHNSRQKVWLDAFSSI